MEGKEPRLVSYGGENYGMPLELTDGLIVPNDRFFVRCNGGIPELTRATWQLHITGAVEREISLDFAQLLELGSKSITAWLECAGNGRTFHNPPTDGTPWLNDAAGNAEWTGVPLQRVLGLAGMEASAVDLVTWGADLENMGRALPVATALDPAFMLVHTMNGEPLPSEHGGPVRLLAPGWAGIASTKWVTRIEVLDHPFVGHYQGTMYTVYDADETPLRPVREMPVKSLIATPTEGQRFVAGEIEIRGYAWSGYGDIAQVDVSLDGGDKWEVAEIVASAGTYSWVQWRHTWRATAGRHSICSRATDERRFTQPRVAQWNARGYLMNAIHCVAVNVE